MENMWGTASIIGFPPRPFFFLLHLYPWATVPKPYWLGRPHLGWWAASFFHSHQLLSNIQSHRISSRYFWWLPRVTYWIHLSVALLFSPSWPLVSTRGIFHQNPNCNPITILSTLWSLHVLLKICGSGNLIFLKQIWSYFDQNWSYF